MLNAVNLWRVHTSLLSDVFDVMLFINKKLGKMNIALVTRFSDLGLGIKRIASDYKYSISQRGCER